MTLADLLFDALGDPDAIAVHVGEEVVTRAALAEQAEAWARRLRDAGVEEGHAVAVSLPNGVALVAVLFGVWRAGAVYVPVNPRLTDRERDAVLGVVRPAVTLREGAHPPDVVVEPAPDPARYDAGVALVQMTSGTTGRPKAVLLDHDGVLALLDGVLGSLRGGATAGRPGGTRPAMPNLVPVSLSLWAGIYQVLFAFRAGAPVVLLERFQTRAFAETVARFGIRSVVLPPAAMTMLADDTTITSLAPLRYVRSITAPLSPLQARRFMERFGIAVLNGYGQTEIGGEIVGWTAADAREFTATKLGAAGRPHPGVEVRAVDDQGRALGPDGSGELVVRTPALGAGYADGRDLSDRMTPDGWFRTGDVGRVDAEGFVWIEGRVSDMINRGGLKVFPAEVEEVLRLAPEVADVAVVGVPDARLGEVPWAFVVVAPGGALDLDALVRTCREHLAPYKVPVRFETLEALPRNDVGKVLGRKLVERARHLAEGSPTTPDTNTRGR